MEPIRIDVFTDPMMGLSYEHEPVLEQLRNHYGNRLVINYVMVCLVRDVSDFMNEKEKALPAEQGIAAYNRRLAGIYRSEEGIGGLPMNMEGFHLFDENHRSSLPLCLAYEAARLSDPERAYDYLLGLRRATILESIQTTRGDELLKLAEKAGIDRSLLLQHLRDGSAEEAFREDEKQACACAVQTLPAYLIQYGSRERMVRYLADAQTFIRIIDSLTEEKRCA